MTAGVTLVALLLAAAIVPTKGPDWLPPSPDANQESASSRPPAQLQYAQSAGRGGRDDGGAARSDALMGTPNKVTPVPQNNLFSTSPRLEQQPPKPDAVTVPSGDTRGSTPAPLGAPR